MCFPCYKIVLLFFLNCNYSPIHFASLGFFKKEKYNKCICTLSCFTMHVFQVVNITVTNRPALFLPEKSLCYIVFFL